MFHQTKDLPPIEWDMPFIPQERRLFVVDEEGVIRRVFTAPYDICVEEE